MATLVDNPSFTANEIYEIMATDPVEGAAAGASFSGIGIDNEPHQQLANRTAFLKGRQDTNIANISVLQTFEALFVGLMGPNGYLKLGVADVNLGLSQYILQWGFQSFSFASNDINITVTWPIAFPSACYFAMAAAQGDDFSAGLRAPSVPAFTKTVGNFVMGWNGSNDDPNPRGFYWFAIGF